MKYSVKPEKTQDSGFGKTSFLRAFFTLAFVAVATFSFGQSPDVRAAFRLIDIEQPSKGIAALEKLAGTSAENQYYLGLGYLRAGDKDKASAAFDKAVSMDEKNGLGHAGKGHVKMIEKNNAEAKAHFDKALAVSKSKNVGVLKAVAEGYLVDSKLVLDAINLLNKAKGINGADPEVHILLGDAYLKQNNGGESVSSYERAANADKKNAKPHLKVAKVYQRSRNYDLVLENLNKAISVDPEYAPAYNELGDLYYTRKEADKAVEAIEKYMSISENKEQAKFKQAFFYVMAKQYEKGIAVFRQVTSSPDAPPVALKYHAWVLSQRLEKKDDTTTANALEAQKLFDRYFTAAKPEDINANDYGYYAQVLLKLKQPELAISNLTKGFELDSTQTDMLQTKGDAEMKLKKYADAANTFNQLMKARNRTIPLSQDLWSIGQAYYFSEQYHQADTAFTKLSEQQPKVTHGWLWSARSRANIDSTMTQGLAKDQYEKFLELALESPEKYKRDIIEAYSYLGAYTVQVVGNVSQAKPYYEKILALDPKNEQAVAFFQALNSPADKQKGR